MSRQISRFPPTNSQPPHHRSKTLTIMARAPKRIKRNHPSPDPPKEQNYWLLKTEPDSWSWADQSRSTVPTKWDGVKNKQAQNNLKSMHLGDLCFFYHSGAKSRRVVGVVSVVREWYEEEDGAGGAVDVETVGEMRRHVDLKEMKGDEKVKGWVLFRQPRLSVVPVPKGVWDRVCELGGGYGGDGGGVSKTGD